ncbi:MAG TPA: cation:proton antiporter [Candidatus Binatia bacterium]|nr:cation:proton antiporter [Candidatus Binatia bacterium]
MIAAVVYVIIGTLLVVMALSRTVLKRLPLTTSLLYLVVGILLGPFFLGMIQLDPVQQPALLEKATEVAVVISLFTTGLKLRLPLSDKGWRLPLRLALVSMTITVGLVALIGVVGFNLPLGGAVLLGAILAPTDPVLASDVQSEHPWDVDSLRFGLTGEAGLNDGTAFPFVMLGLGLLGLHEIGEFGWRWLALDVLWATAGGLGVGGVLGTLVGRLVLYLRGEHKEAVGTDDFLALGLIAFSYGSALLIGAYGFLAVFAAGVALRRIERRHSEGSAEENQGMSLTGEADEIATDPRRAPAYMAQAVLQFNEQLERIGEVAIVVLVGGMLSTGYLSLDAVWFVLVLLLVVRPISVWLGLLGSSTSITQRNLIGWFGIRGIGSIYYLAYAINHGLAPELSTILVRITLSTVAMSVLVHGTSVTPLMRLYEKKRSRLVSANITDY